MLGELILDRATLGLLIAFGSFAGGFYAVHLRKPVDPNDP